MSRRRNPVMNTQVYSQKVSPFKPMGGGFKQNLNIEVSPTRIAREVALARQKVSSNTVFGYRNHSRHMSNNTLDLAIAERPEESQVGLNIDSVPLHKKRSAAVTTIKPIEEAKPVS